MKKTFLFLLLTGVFMMGSCSKPSAEKYANQWCDKYRKGVQYTKEKKFDEAIASFEEMDRFYKETAKKFGKDQKFMDEFQRLARDCKNAYQP